MSDTGPDIPPPYIDPRLFETMDRLLKKRIRPWNSTLAFMEDCWLAGITMTIAPPHEGES
jgi:hypothetical protein